VRIQKLRKSYNNKTVLQLEDFCFEADRIYAVVGTNGCGKSTLARILAAVLPPDKGSLILGREDYQISYMPQKSYGFQMQALKNVLLPCPKDASRKQQALDYMRALGILELAQQPGHRLSGGETARVALARTLMSDGNFLILDEPTAAMDMQSTLAAEKLIREYQREKHCLVLLVTHSIKQAERLADELLFFQEGQLVEAGPCREMLQAPRDPRTRVFLDFYSST